MHYRERRLPYVSSWPNDCVPAAASPGLPLATDLPCHTPAHALLLAATPARWRCSCCGKILPPTDRLRIMPRSGTCSSSLLLLPALISICWGGSLAHLLMASYANSLLMVPATRKSL